MKHQAPRIKPRANRGSTLSLAVRERMLSREIHRAIHDIAASLGLPPNPTRQLLAAEMKRAEKGSEPYMHKKFSDVLNVPIIKRWMALQGLEGLINRVERFENPDPGLKVKELLAIRADAHRVVEGVL